MYIILREDINRYKFNIKEDVYNYIYKIYTIIKSILQLLNIHIDVI